MRRGVREVFRELGLESQVYVAVFVAITFSGNLFGRFAPHLILVALTLLLWMAATPYPRVGGYFNHRYHVQFLILLTFSAFLFWQTSVAYEPGLVWTYLRRFLIFSLLLLIVPRPDVCFTAIKACKYYALVVAGSILILEIATGSKTGGLVGDYQYGGMMMSIACILFLIDYYHDGGRTIDVIGFTLALISLFTTGKRMFALIALLGLALLYLMSQDRQKRARSLKLVSLGLIAVTPVYLFMEPVRLLFQRMELFAMGKFAATSGRNVLWNVAYEIFQANPLTGIGFANFAVFYAAHYHTRESTVQLTHNIYYGLLAETGVVGFALIVGLFTFTLLQSWKVFRVTRAEHVRVLNYVMTYSISLQVWFIVYGLTGNGIYGWHEFFLYISAVAMMISVRLALDRPASTGSTIPERAWGQ